MINNRKIIYDNIKFQEQCLFTIDTLECKLITFQVRMIISGFSC